MLSNINEDIKKNKGIVYCRLSRVPDVSRGILSLDSQEFAIKNSMDANNIEIFSVHKHVGSAYKTPQTELKQILNNSRNKILFVYESNRLSRKVENFNKIWNICKRRNHVIACVTECRVFYPKKQEDYFGLLKLIEIAQKESSDMGRRISRTAEYKRSKEPLWGKERNDKGELVDNRKEIMISKLICLLGSSGSSVSEIRYLISQVGSVEDRDAFEIVEYDVGTDGFSRDVDKLPYPMSLKNIEDTLKIYNVRKRKARWTIKDIKAVLQSTPVIQSPIHSVESLCEDFEMVNTGDEGDNESDSQVDENINNQGKEWIVIWYDPAFGLPPNIIIPEGMTLPTVATTIYIPKV